MSDEQAMWRALELALKGSGFVSPNPRVGCVIVKDGRVIGEGWHRYVGGPHAEVEAIRNATEDVAGATLVVNLEPCAHYGKTPPCTDLIIEKKIGRVVIGMLDPNPVVNGKGVQRLREAGIAVNVGVLEKEAQWINRFFTKYVRTHFPYVILKIAQTLDGYIATNRGSSKWITGPESRKRVHQLRAEVDAVLIGERTARVDNPSLTVREIPGRSPKRIVLDPELSLPLQLNLFLDPYRRQTIVVCKEDRATSHKANDLRLSGVTVLPVPEAEPGQLDLCELLRKLGEMEITSILVEGGGQVFSSFVHNELVDEFHFFIAPKFFGKGLPAFSGLNAQNLAHAYQVFPISCEPVDRDFHVLATPLSIAVPQWCQHNS